MSNSSLGVGAIFIHIFCSRLMGLGSPVVVAMVVTDNAALFVTAICGIGQVQPWPLLPLTYAL